MTWRPLHRMLFKLLGVEKTKAKAGQPIRQVFLTQSHILAQRVQEYYIQLYGAATLGVGDGGPSTIDSMSLFQLDEESDFRSDLPARFSELKDDHFPLFVTFNQVRHPAGAIIHLSARSFGGNDLNTFYFA